MAKATVSEYRQVARDQSGQPLHTPLEPALAVNEVDFTAGEAKSPNFNTRTRFVLVAVDTAARYQIGANPTAVASGDFTRIAANTAYFFGVRADNTLRISFITEV